MREKGRVGRAGARVKPGSGRNKARDAHGVPGLADRRDQSGVMFWSTQVTRPTMRSFISSAGMVMSA